MPIIKTIRNHKYQILSENEFEIKVIDKSTSRQLTFTKIEGKSEDDLNEMFPGIPVLKYKNNGYYFLDLKIRSKDMSAEVYKSPEHIEISKELDGLRGLPRINKTEEVKLKIKELSNLKKNSPIFKGRISHTNLLRPIFDSHLKSLDLFDALKEISQIKSSLPAEFQANLFGKKLRKAKEITDGKNIKI